MFCVTQSKEAHFTEQTDHPSPGTDVLDKGTHLAVPHTKAVARSCKGWSAEPPWIPSRCNLAGRLFLSFRSRFAMFSCKGAAGTDLQGYKRSTPSPLTTHLHFSFNSPSYPCSSVPLGVLHLVVYLEKRRRVRVEERRSRVCRNLLSFCTSTDLLQLELHLGYLSIFLSLLFD